MRSIEIIKTDMADTLIRLSSGSTDILKAGVRIAVMFDEVNRARLRYEKLYLGQTKRTHSYRVMASERLQRLNMNKRKVNG